MNKARPRKLRPLFKLMLEENKLTQLEYSALIETLNMLPTLAMRIAQERAYLPR